MMVEVYEARLPASMLGGANRSALHGRIDGMLLRSRRDETPRKHVWGFVDDETVLIRAVKPSGSYFSPVVIPTVGVIAFGFDAAPKTGHAGRNRHRSKKPIRGEAELAAWARVKLPACGIAVTELDVMEYDASIAKVGSLMAATISGTGIITDSALFSEAMINGVAGGGPKCWGFATLVVDQA